MRLQASIFTFITWLLLLTNSVTAQPTPRPRCATNAVNQRLVQRYPQLRTNHQQVRGRAQTYLAQKKTARRQQPVTVIPVVFHVVYRTSLENIPTEQLLSQIEVLNTDYRRRNADSAQTLPQFKSVAADTRIEFCLASRDPQGNFTTGIVRSFASVDTFSVNDAVKYAAFAGQDAWDRNRYLNIWVCDLSGDNLGYAQYPDGPAETDGVVLDYTTLGRAPVNPFRSVYNLGRTATHEVGHWLGLQHIWGEADSGCADSDDIADTPNQDDATTVCPTGPEISCNNGPAGDMYQNYLDYTDDACMNLFTRDQAAYMQAVLNTTRSRILTAAVCPTPLRADFEASDTLIVAGSTVQFQDASVGVRANAWQWTFAGAHVVTTATVANPEVRFDQPGQYTVSLAVSLGTITDTITKQFYIRVTSTEEVIYPNPTSGQVTLEAPADRALKEIYLINSIGQVILRQPTNINFVTLSLRSFANGMYYCRFVYPDGRLVTKKLLLVR